MKYKYFIIFPGLVLSGLILNPGKSYAQLWSDSYGALTYNMGLPMGDTKDYTDFYSWRGVGMEFRKFYSTNISLGLSFGWNVFHDESSGTYEIVNGSGHVTGDADKTINALPIMASIQYYLGEGGGTRPYIGLNGPGFYMIQRMDIGVFSFQDEGWNWGLAPEVGFVLPLQSEASMLFDIRYNYAFEMDNRGPYSYIGINIGLAWTTF